MMSSMALIIMEISRDRASCLQTPDLVAK
jgi:hypothetical protein